MLLLSQIKDEVDDVFVSVSYVFFNILIFRQGAEDRPSSAGSDLPPIRGSTPTVTEKDILASTLEITFS